MTVRSRGVGKSPTERWTDDGRTAVRWSRCRIRPIFHIGSRFTPRPPCPGVHIDRARTAFIGSIILAVAFAAWPAATLVTASDATASVVAGATPPAMHFELRMSAPQADSTVVPTDEVRLWFTQEPQDGTTQIRVMKDGELVPAADAQMDPEDATSYFVQHDMPLDDGEYRVLWRSMAPDGHVVDGEFGFRIAETGVGR